MKNFLSVLVLFLGFNAFAAIYCVGPAATGSGSGADWNNLKAWTDTPVRGDTWYLKDGTYSGKALSTANSGTTPITIKKAIGATGQTGHGTDSGWVQATMGAGQATITGEITVNSSYWVIDGQKGNGFSVLPPDTNGNNYGIAMTSGYRCVTIPAPNGNLTLSHIYAAQQNNDTAAGSGWFVGDGDTVNGTVDKITVSHCLLVLWGQAVRADTTWNNLVFEYNCYWTIYASSAAHANPINASYGDINNSTVRYNLFYKNVPGNWGFSQVIAANNANWNGGKIYGNVFDHCWSGRSIISGNGRPNDAVYNLLVYNNTFLWSAKDYPNDGGGLIGDEYSSGNTFVNNLAYFCNAEVSDSANDYNEYIATWRHPTESHGVIIPGSYDPFMGAANQNYALKTNTPPGMPLGAEYAQDALGNTRTTWSRGAFEYNGVPSTNPVISVSPGALDFGAIAVGTTKDLTYTVRNSGGGTLTGTATVPAPFSIVSSGTYTLSSQSFTVTVRYSPGAAGNHSQSVTNTGGGGASLAVSGSAWSVLPGLSFGASAGTITQPFITSTSGFISQSVETGVTDGGRAVYGFTVPSAGNYKVMANVNAPSEAANSIFVNIDAEPTDPTMVWDIPVTTGFTNLAAAWRGNGTYTANEFAPKIFTLSAGTHQLIVRGREGGVQLNQITIQKQLAAPPNMRAN